jgi:hypothetical protein
MLVTSCFAPDNFIGVDTAVHSQNDTKNRSRMEAQLGKAPACVDYPMLSIRWIDESEFGND